MKKSIGRSMGIFDSGFGGISVLEGIVDKLPEYNYIYLGDTARAPSKLENYLKRHKDRERKIGKNRIVKFYSTDLTDKFKKLGAEFFGKRINVKRATLI